MKTLGRKKESEYIRTDYNQNKREKNQGRSERSGEALCHETPVEIIRVRSMKRAVRVDKSGERETLHDGCVVNIRLFPPAVLKERRLSQKKLKNERRTHACTCDEETSPHVRQPCPFHGKMIACDTGLVL